MDQILIGNITKTAFDKTFIYPIYEWPGYGVVCPGLLTTNGYYYVLREYLLKFLDKNYIENIKVDIKDFSIDIPEEVIKYFKLNEMSTL